MAELKPVQAIKWEALRAPFPMADVEIRLNDREPKEFQGKMKSRALAYVDARAVMDRLDAVVGQENWTFDWQPILTNGDELLIAKGTLTIGGISKSDVGDSDRNERTKACVSDALKRAAVQFGIGRYLYEVGTNYVEVEQKYGTTWVPKEGEKERIQTLIYSRFAQPEDVQATVFPDKTTNQQKQSQHEQGATSKPAQATSSPKQEPAANEPRPTSAQKERLKTLYYAIKGRHLTIKELDVTAKEIEERIRLLEKVAANQGVQV